MNKNYPRSCSALASKLMEQGMMMELHLFLNYLMAFVEVLCMCIVVQ